MGDIDDNGIARRRLLWGSGIGLAGVAGVVGGTVAAPSAYAGVAAPGAPAQAPEPLTRNPFYIVAASDAPTEMKDAADFVCDGTDDQDEVHAALQLGNVQLTDGTYHVDPMIEITQSDRWLRGTGPGSIVRTIDRNKSQGPANFGTVTVIGAPQAHISNVWVTDLTVDGNRPGQSGTAPGHPMDYGEGVELDYCDDTRVENVIIHDTVADGIDWDYTNRSFCHNLTITRCGGFGIHIATDSHRTVVDGAHIVDTGLDDGLRGGFDLGTSNNLVSNITVEDSHGLYSGVMGGTDNTGMNVRVRGPGLRVGGTRVTLANIVLDGEDDNGWPALQVSTASEQAIIENVTIHSYTGATMLIESEDTHLSGIRASGQAAEFAGTSANCLVSSSRLPGAPTDNGTGNRFVSCASPQGASEGSGTAVIPNGASTVSVPHGLWAAPTVVTATPHAPETVAVSARDGSSFTVSRSGTSGDLAVDWTAHT